MSWAGISIRPIVKEDVPQLERHINFDWAAFGKHAERCINQQEGDVTYLVAWLEDLPVGHTLIEWNGPDVEPMASQLLSCPEIEDLFVVPKYRRMGVGSLMLDHAESLALQRGYIQIGLGVDIDNPRARRLYERRGYKDAGYGEYTTSWSYLDRDGQEQRATEIGNYLVKRLPDTISKAVSTGPTVSRLTTFGRSSPGTGGDLWLRSS